MHGSEGTKWIFVMSTFKKLYAGLKKKGRFHHSSFLAGGATLAAGRVVVDNGVLKTISAYSGHYKPSDDSLDIFLSFLRENAVNLDGVEVHKASEDSDSYDDYFKPNGDGTKSLKKEEPTPSNAEAETDENGNGTLEEIKRSSYQRTLSGGLESPKADVPQKAILQRINSKKQSKSLQLGHQLMLKWSTGAGPRIARELPLSSSKVSPSSTLDLDVERSPFMLMLSVTPEISWKLQLYFIGLKREDHDPASAESLRKKIAVMEDKLNTKEELTKKHTRFIQESHIQVKEQIEKQSGGAGISINIKKSLNSK
ncbi:hypothetical protein F2Q70_00043796 [Brassica cretica]|uniref:Uncharacterized protein n=1 Tax=Brassica cretica TaxID=69181 RepID=A0A8S9KGI0_BRACR|nr:hypothetical protein F2Q70_00043796 [Brassica cretica]